MLEFFVGRTVSNGRGFCDLQKEKSPELVIWASSGLLYCLLRRIPTTFGQTLSWEYLRYVRTHPARRWRTPTAILYGARDHLTDRETVEAFAARNGCRLTVEEAGEHWFHTPEQLAVVDRWQRACLADLE